MTVFHIAHAIDWHDAERSDEYRVSTRGRSLDEVGFIHCSTAEQVTGVAEAFYSDDPLTLIVLELDTVAIESAGIAVRWEEAGAGQLFPHVYGPLKPEFVVSVTPLVRG